MVYYEKDNLAIIEFNDANSKVNVLSYINLEILERCIYHIEKRPGLKAVFFISSKKGVFLAGADIKELSEIKTREEILRLCKKGQDIFDRIERLEIPTISVVNGACVGGGLELALSCRYIFATPNKKVRFAFPEIRLGICPGFGGTYRLPRRIGNRYAQELITTGRFIDAKEAYSIKLIDRIISEKGINNLTGILRYCKKKTYKPILNERLAGLNTIERETVADKILREPARNALDIFLLIRKYKTYPWIDLPRTPTLPSFLEIDSSTVIGVGKMGRGIAYLTSLKGLKTYLIEKDKKNLKYGLSEIKRLYADAVRRGVIESREARQYFKNISFNNVSIRDSDILIEAVTEDISIKKMVFSDIEPLLKKDCIIATNTSCISIHGLSKSLKYPERFLGVHFFNPPYKMKLVEVIPATFTNATITCTIIELLRGWGKVPIIVKDTPGFLINRILLPYLNEALIMVEEGFSVQDIEGSMLEFGMPMGPIELLEHIGISTAYRATKLLEESLGRIKTSKILKESAEKNLRIMIDKMKRPSFTQSKDSIKDRLLQCIKREAELCLKENVVEHREVIDVALHLGIGFPPTKRIWNPI